MNINDIDFISDSSHDETNSNNEINNCNMNISTIFNIIKQQIVTNKSLKKINLIAEVMEIRDYKGMAFLKIKDNTDAITAIIYKTVYKNDFVIGNKINLDCSLDLFRGQLQLVIKSYKSIGSGENNSKLIILKNKLNGLGYFDNKPALETNYTTIGVISSLNAAGMKDFFHVLLQRCCNKKLYIYPCSVQGKNAVDEIRQAIELANRHDMVEILVLIRGGGAKEDLECFNSEELANSIHGSKIPVVTGIGHQIDVSIADLVCIKSFITPTAVAQNITMENINSKSTLNKLLAEINNKIINRLDKYHQYIDYQENKLVKYQNNILDQVENDIDNHKNKINQMKKNIISCIDLKHDYICEQEKYLAELLSSHDSNITQQLSQSKNNLLQNIDLCGQTIAIYEEKCKVLTQPHILDKNGNEILSSNTLVKGQTYQICFMDGIFDLNLK